MTLYGVLSFAGANYEKNRTFVAGPLFLGFIKN